LLAERRALVLVVWKAGLASSCSNPIGGRPSAGADRHPTALDIDQAMYEQAQRLAEKGARIAREAASERGPLVVAEDAEVPISRRSSRPQERGSTRRGVGQRARGTSKRCS